jgi:hypothetical protein
MRANHTKNICKRILQKVSLVTIIQTEKERGVYTCTKGRFFFFLSSAKVQQQGELRIHIVINGKLRSSCIYKSLDLSTAKTMIDMQKGSAICRKPMIYMWQR